MSEKLSVLVADDSIVYRKLLSDILAQRDDIELIGTAPNGAIALSKIELKKPDLALLDVTMPEMNGLELLEAINNRQIPTEVIFVSGVSRENAAITLKALELGALDFIAKPQTDSVETSLHELTAALTPLLNLAKTKKYTRRVKTAQTSHPITEKLGQKPMPVRQPPETFGKPIKPVQGSPARITRRDIPRIDVVAIGVSTGGPNALNRIIPQLAKNIPVPILVVQHMPATFTASLAERLDKASRISVEEAAAGMTIEKGRMYLAQGGKHMVVRQDHQGKSTIGQTESPPVHSCRPAVDVLFRSVAMVYGKNILAVILTGMGNDGALGVAAIRRRGGYCLVQDEASSVVWGMPSAVVQAGDADEIVELDRLPSRINDIVGLNR